MTCHAVKKKMKPKTLRSSATAMHRLKTSMPGMEAEKAAERKKAERDVREVSVTAGPASASAIDVPSARSVTDGPTAFIALMKMKVQSTPTQSTRNSTKAQSKLTRKPR